MLNKSIWWTIGSIVPEAQIQPLQVQVAYTLTLFRANAGILPTVRSSLGVCFREQSLPLAFGAVLAGANLDTRNMKYEPAEIVELIMMGTGLK